MTQKISFQFLIFFSKWNTYFSTFVFSLEHFHETHLLRRLLTTSKLLNKLIWRCLVSLVWGRTWQRDRCCPFTCINLVVTEGVRQEAQMINVCQCRNLHADVLLISLRLADFHSLQKGVNRAQEHVLQTTTALIWQVLSTSRTSICSVARNLIKNCWMSSRSILQMCYFFLLCFFIVSWWGIAAQNLIQNQKAFAIANTCRYRTLHKSKLNRSSNEMPGFQLS